MQIAYNVAGNEPLHYFIFNFREIAGMSTLSPQDILLAKILLEQGFVRLEDLVESLQELAQKEALRLDRALSIGRLISQNQWGLAREIYQRRVQVRKPYVRQDLEDNLMSRLLCQNNWLQPEDVQAAMLLQRKEEEGGFFPRLGQVMVDKGMAKRDKVQEILDHLAKNVLICPGCHQQYSATDQPEGNFPCRQCSRTLTLPQPTCLIPLSSSSASGGDSLQLAAIPYIDEQSDDELEPFVPEEKEELAPPSSTVVPSPSDSTCALDLVPLDPQRETEED